MISRRTLIRRAAAAAALWPISRRVSAQKPPAPQVLYNGITLGSPWPPSLKYPNEHPVPPPYLVDPPPVIPIDVGRQLFVDDFLIADTTMERTCHRAVYHAANPVLRPSEAWEQHDDYASRTKTRANPSAMPFSDGVFFDPGDRRFKLWYMGGYQMYTCYATSEDGITWRKPALDIVPGTNIVTKLHRDSTTVWLDLFETDPRQRFKMSLWYDHYLVLSVSADGIHWTEIGRTGQTGDRSTFFYNPFRRVWGFSLRYEDSPSQLSGRYRRYWESPAFADARGWSGRQAVAWVKADSHDHAVPGMARTPELYNLDCVAYESVLLGLFSIWRGESQTREKINDVTLGFSRDGFHWHRPDRAAFLPVSEEEGSWNWANVQSAGGGCLVVGDRLYFYVSGRQGRPGTAEPGVCSTGLATLRRDGFASMDWLPGEARVLRQGRDRSLGGTLTTRQVRFSGGHLFVNADVRGGELRVEVLDARGQVIAPFTREACAPITGDSTRQAVKWTAGALADVAGNAVRFRFSMTRGRLYAFWVSAGPNGESGGYPAAGGPEFSGPVDTRRV